jgi:CubicO group peptidase (beta-lactamase class C family)
MFTVFRTQVPPDNFFPALCGGYAFQCRKGFFAKLGIARFDGFGEKLVFAAEMFVKAANRVHKLAPEVWFENRWEASHPVRVVHLLEHTTGWDDIHLREFAKDAPGMGLREALDYDRHSRTSRWRPGTRMAYCNSGPAVAAYIVEKLTGQHFEDFVEQNLFRPIGMKTATYFEPAPGTATTLYHHDGKTPYRYWNLLLRPAGSINASANDMAAYLQFHLNRGAVKGKQIVPAADIDRMEIPATTWAAIDGMKTGYGLSNFWSIEDGFVYHRHDGGVAGGHTEMAYMADYGVGYFFSINSEAGEDAFYRIDKLISAYLTNKLQKPSLPPVAPLLPSTAEYAGWYEPASPRTELFHFVERLAGAELLSRMPTKVNSLWPNPWPLIALHSPTALLETGLRMCPREKSRVSDLLRC